MSGATWDAFCGRLFDQNAFAIKLGLDNIRRAFALEGHPERCAPAIVVGGTNGKGSVASMLAAFLTAHGLRVGLYTSPHLVEFRERFRIDGRPVSRDVVLDHGRVVMERYAGPDAEPQLSFFELSTVMAARIFEEAGVDVVVWEVGLGGRLDAVNAIEPALTVVTRIDLDHQQYLGDTVARVAREKAGLHRLGVPLVLAPQLHDEVYDVFDFDEVLRPSPAAIHAGRSQLENSATARAAARAFLGARFDPVRADRGFEAWRWPGRNDWRVAHGRRFLLDAAHNPAGVEELLPKLHADHPAACVIGAMADKQLDGMFGGLSELGFPIFVAEIDSARAASAEVLRGVVGDVTASGSASSMFEAASRVGDYVVVFGSVYLLGEWFAWAEIDVDELTTFNP